jgi:hypothetical protein
VLADSAVFEMTLLSNTLKNCGEGKDDPDSEN